MSRPDRRAMMADYKQTPRKAGLYALRCSGEDAVWIGASLNLEKAANRHWFTLRIGTHHCPALQAAWNTHGADAFTFEILETLADDLSALARDNLLKEMRRDRATKPGTILL